MLRKDFHDLTENGEIGDWAFIRDDSYICICYPVASSYPEEPPLRDYVAIPINKPDPNSHTKIFWTWDGNKDAPTITPSIRVLGGSGQPDVWHGFLTAGKLTSV